jgi:hypothetical protein
MKLPASQTGWIALTARGNVPKSQTRNGCPVVWFYRESVPVAFTPRLVKVTIELLDAEDAATLPPVAAKQRSSGMSPTEAFSEGQKILKELK